MQQYSRGILIAVEGIDGSGKSTLCSKLFHSLSIHTPTILTKEPGGTQLGLQLRSLVQSDVARCAKTEFLLFAADRAQHFTEIIEPALAAKKIIISDRMADSSLVYQGYGRGLDHHMISTINKWTMNAIVPDLTIYVRIPLTIAYNRIRKRNAELTSFEKEKEIFLQKLIDGFDTLYKERADVITIDGTQSIESLYSDAYKKIITWISSHHGAL